jgi:predicted DCC family thiol-disulfide oxidoreductase YuxK
VNRITLRQALRRTYLTVDARSLGLARVLIGAVLLVDLLRRVPLIDVLYTNVGLLPNHTMLWRPPLPRLISVFFAVSLPHEAIIVFAICFVSFFCFMIGWRTRAFHLLSFLLATSLHNRVTFVENWGSVALGACMVWTAFMPLGRRFSVDAVLASMRAHAGEGPDDLAPARVLAQVEPQPDEQPFVSLAVLGVLLQIAVIYGFNYVQKAGPTWREGSAVHYVLWQERIVTPLGLWARMNLPLAFTKTLTFATLVTEALAPVLVLTPFLSRWARGLAVLALSAFHIGLALLINLGIFSAAMLCFMPMLLDAAHWRLLARLVPTRGRRRLVFYDAGCGVCFHVVRVLARLDVHRRLGFIANQDRAALPEGVDPALLESTILVVDPARNRRWTRADAFAEILAALPFGRLGAWVLRVPGLRAIAGAAYDLFARNRTAISGWLGLAACGVPGAAAPPRPLPPPRTPLGAWLRGRLPLVRELGVVLVAVIFCADLTVVNAAMPAALRWGHRPQWMAYAVMYPRIFQSWSMFSPDAPYGDEMMVIDAITRDGRHVDPFNEVASRVATLPVEGQIPPRLGQSSFMCDYALKIPEAGSYFQALIEWVQRYPVRTGRARDQIVSFTAWKVEQASPAPGQTQPSFFRKQMFLQWPPQTGAR